MRSRVSLFLQAWLGDFKRSDVERKKLGEIAKNVRDKQSLAYAHLYSLHSSKRKEVVDGKYSK